MNAMPDDASDASDPYSRLTKEQKECIDKVEIDPDNVLYTEEQRLRVRQLLARFHTIFALDPKNPKQTHLTQVELPLKEGAVPHRHAASKLGERGRVIVEEHVDEMEARGILRNSNSAWGSRVVLVTHSE